MGFSQRYASTNSPFSIRFDCSRPFSPLLAPSAATPARWIHLGGMAKYGAINFVEHSIAMSRKTRQTAGSSGESQDPEGTIDYSPFCCSIFVTSPVQPV
jgi:hypothetical protein